ncbi:hypothetical protein NDU88_005131 [Pleurodeles waltl]|uniref:Uncharacterized protein n=1 Tax=Pleurodeles waltl TaxID=8319 RepID=A0AAV7M936_PLEWA|nr:hypothetical protein NDU88_005131 [Pleurodeles waltl]
MDEWTGYAEPGERSQDGDRVGRLSSELRLGSKVTILQGAPNGEIGALKCTTGPGVDHGTGGPSGAAQERGAREHRGVSLAMAWRHIGGSSSRGKRIGVPRCSRGRGKRRGGFGTGEALRSGTRASVRLLPSPLRPPLPPADLRGACRRTRPDRLSFAGRVAPAEHGERQCGGAAAKRRGRPGCAEHTRRQAQGEKKGDGFEAAWDSQALTRPKGAAPKHIGDSPPTAQLRK